MGMEVEGGSGHGHRLACGKIGWGWKTISAFCQAMSRLRMRIGSGMEVAVTVFVSGRRSEATRRSGSGWGWKSAMLTRASSASTSRKR